MAKRAESVAVETKSVNLPAVKPKKGKKELTLAEKVDKIREVANDFMVVGTSEQKEQAVAFLKAGKTMLDHIEEALGPQVKAAYDSWQVALNQKKTYEKPVKEAIDTVKKKITAFDLAEEERREEERREAARLAAIEQEKLRKKLERRAAKAKTQEETEELLEMAENVHVPVTTVEAIQPKMAGISSTATVEIEVTDIKKFLGAVIAGEVKIDLSQLVMIKQSVLKTYVKMTGATVIPGCALKKSMVQRVI